jgi:hypothetical protein
MEVLKFSTPERAARRFIMELQRAMESAMNRRFCG